jgi:hypothetical protein
VNRIINYLPQWFRVGPSCRRTSRRSPKERTEKARRNRLKRADVLFMRFLLSEKYKLCPEDLAEIIEPALLISIAEASGLVAKIRAGIFKELRASLISCFV